MKTEKKPFWEAKSLAQMTASEWEALCDGCALCCLHKFEDSDTLEIFYTGVSCRLLDTETCLCQAYGDRFTLVKNCINIRAKHFNNINLLPQSCAYRRLAKGERLEWWHHLLSKDKETVHEEGISARGKTIPEENVHPEDIARFVLFKND